MYNALTNQLLPYAHFYLITILRRGAAGFSAAGNVKGLLTTSSTPSSFPFVSFATPNPPPPTEFTIAQVNRL